MPIIVGELTQGTSGLAYKNLYNEAGVTVTVSSEDTANGYFKENAYDWLGYDSWKPTVNGDSWIRASFASSKTANYFAVWGHDLADHGASVTPQYSVNGGSTWLDLSIEVAPVNNKVLFFPFDDIPAADFRLLVSAPTTIPAIAGVMVGELLRLTHALEVGFAPPSLVVKKRIKTALSEKGVFIGGSTISEGISGEFNLTKLDPVWVRTEWLPFIEHLQTPKPFVFAWDGVSFPAEVVLAWAEDGTDLSPPRYNDSLHMDISLSFDGIP